MQTMIFKLVSGEEIITKIISESEDEFMIDDVRTLVIQPTGPGTMGIALLPWMATMSEGEIPLKKRDIMVKNENVPKNLEDGYFQETSGIQLVGK